MRSPSIQKLMTALLLNREQAKQVKTLCALADKPDALADYIERHCQATARYARACFNDPYTSGMWRRTMVLHAINDIVGAHGVEALGESGDYRDPPPYEYLNFGDPYTMTLVYRAATDNLWVGVWGSIAEKMS